MADLSTIDPLTPIATALVSGGDDEIRELKDMVKTSFGGSDAGDGVQLAEHYLMGMHKFPSGTTAQRPTTGNPGRVYHNTEYRRVERDDAVFGVWAHLNAVTIGADSGAITVSTSWQTVCTVSINVIPYGRLLCFATTQWTASLAAESIQHRIQVDGSNIANAGTLTQTIAAGVAMGTTVMGYDLGPSTGTLSITIDTIGTVGGQSSVTHLIVCVM